MKNSESVLNKINEKNLIQMNQFEFLSNHDNFSIPQTNNKNNIHTNDIINPKYNLKTKTSPEKDLKNTNNFTKIINLLTSIIAEIKKRNNIKNINLDTLLRSLKDIDTNSNIYIDHFLTIEDYLAPDINFLGVNAILSENKYKNLTYDIFKYLNAKDLVTLGMTCKNLKEICSDNKYWNPIYFKEFDKFLLFGNNGVCKVIENAKERYAKISRLKYESNGRNGRSSSLSHSQSHSQSQSGSEYYSSNNSESDLSAGTYNSNDIANDENDTGIPINPNIPNNLANLSNLPNNTSTSTNLTQNLNSFNFNNKYLELKRLNKSWESDRPIITTISTKECVTCLNLNTSSNELIYSASDGSAALFKLYSYRKVLSSEDLYMQHHKQIKICDRISNFHGHGGSIWCIDRSDDILFTGSYDKTIKIWQASKGDCLTSFRAHNSWVSSINYDKSHNTLVSCSWDCSIKLWNINTMQNTLSLHEENSNALHCVVSNLNENEVIVGNEFKNVDIWNVNRSSKVLSLNGHSERINTLKHRDNLILSGSEDKYARIWDRRTKNTEIVLAGHTKGITQIEYDYLNNRVYTASCDKTIKMWDIRKGSEIRTLVGHSDSVYSLAYDQTKLISGSKDNSIRIWNFLN